METTNSRDNYEFHFLDNESKRKVTLPSLKVLFPSLIQKSSKELDFKQEEFHFQEPISYETLDRDNHSHDNIKCNYTRHTCPGLACNGYNLSSDSFEGTKIFSNLTTSRFRRKSYEVERVYKCIYPGCTKSYGSLSHLNTHVAMKKHGPKRDSKEFLALRHILRTRALNAHYYRYNHY